MDFGLFFLMQRDDAWSAQAVYDSALEQMQDLPGLETAAALRSMRLFAEESW